VSARKNAARPAGGWAGESKSARRAAGQTRLEVWLPPDDAARLERVRHGRSTAEVVRAALAALEAAGLAPAGDDRAENG
jgi:hypothetical protein